MQIRLNAKAGFKFMELQRGAMAGGDRKSDIYERVTRGIRVSVSPHYLEDQSDPDEPRYVWAYTVRINNESDAQVQLRTRYWRITDSRGQTTSSPATALSANNP